VHQPPALEPRDAHNERLLANVHPADWRNPTPADRYNLVVIGAGTAGLITAAVASGLGAKVALVERALLGGDCLNVGCVPSKAVIRSARRAHEARAAAELGLHLAPGADVDFAAVMGRMRGIRARISEDDSARRYQHELGADVFLGAARFAGPDVVEVDGARLRFRRAVIATGARPVEPPVEGLADAGYLTNETVFQLTARPRRLAVIGGGPIGCELAQAFRRLGSEVVLFHDAGHVLNREDADAAAVVQAALAREGVELVLGCRIHKVAAGAGGKSLRFSCEGGGERERVVDEILVGAGRAPNVEGLGLDTVGVAFDARRGVHVDDRLRTTNRRIFAVGDVAMDWKFTHAADAAAKIVVQNALFSFGPIGKKRLSALTMPWCTYTDPEIAHVGLYERDAKQRGIALDTYQVPISRANRAVTDGQEEGLVKIHVKKGTAEIVGATVVAAHAGDLITQLTLAITQKIPLGAFTNVIYPYPTQGEAIKAAAGQYTRTRLTPGVKRLFTALMRLRR
jgi:pyruvate/2-oxoglutarate dehydrogenase complex dihydrolipoamide dehydrogenase (E3) component